MRPENQYREFEIEPLDRSFIQRTFGKMNPGSLRGAIFTLFSTACGVGSLSIPFILKSQGFILGFCVLFFCCFICYLGMINLVLAAEKHQCFIYADLVEKILGKKWRLFFENTMIFFVFGNLIASQVIIGLFLPSILNSFNIPSDSSLERPLCMIVANVIIMVPLGLQRTLTALRFVSIVTPVVILYICIILISEFPLYKPDKNYSEIDYFSPSLSIFPNFSICIFVFTCHSNVSQIYEELSLRSLTRMYKVAWRTFAALLLSYILLGAFGYLSLLNDVPEQIIMRKPPSSISNDWGMVVARVGMTCSLIIGIPLNIPPCRKCIVQCWFRNKEEASKLL